jgi:hypothetical protein
MDFLRMRRVSWLAEGNLCVAGSALMRGQPAGSRTTIAVGDQVRGTARENTDTSETAMTVYGAQCTTASGKHAVFISLEKCLTADQRLSTIACDTCCKYYESLAWNMSILALTEMAVAALLEDISTLPKVIRRLLQASSNEKQIRQCLAARCCA